MTLQKSSINITIAGELGSGKSTVAKILAQKLGFEYFSTGSIQRKIAQSKGLDTLQLNYLSTTNKEIDKLIDDELKRLNTQPTKFVIDSRLGWYFIKESFKIYLIIDSYVSAQRVLNDLQRQNEPFSSSIEELRKNLLERKKIEDERFLSLYNISCSDFKNYDLVIDTSFATIEELVDKILSVYDTYTRGNRSNKIFLSPKNLYPLENIKQLDNIEARKIKESIQKNGYDESTSVVVTFHKGHYFIVDGHKRVSSAILNNIKFIPVHLVNKEDIGHISIIDEYKLSTLHDWEDLHNFFFNKPPIDLSAH